MKMYFIKAKIDTFTIKALSYCYYDHLFVSVIHCHTLPKHSPVTVKEESMLCSLPHGKMGFPPPLAPVTSVLAV